jgi:hypothetical protein
LNKFERRLERVPEEARGNEGRKRRRRLKEERKGTEAREVNDDVSSSS